MKELCERLEMQFMVGQIGGFEEKDGLLTELRVAGADGITRRLPLDDLLVFFGLSPKLGPIAEWGLDTSASRSRSTRRNSRRISGHLCRGRHQHLPARRS